MTLRVGLGQRYCYNIPLFLSSVDCLCLLLWQFSFMQIFPDFLKVSIVLYVYNDQLATVYFDYLSSCTYTAFAIVFKLLYYMAYHFLAMICCLSTVILMCICWTVCCLGNYCMNCGVQPALYISILNARFVNRLH